jgi:hypothetical protein
MTTGAEVLERLELDELEVERFRFGGISMRVTFVTQVSLYILNACSWAVKRVKFHIDFQGELLSKVIRNFTFFIISFRTQHKD